MDDFFLPVFCFCGSSPSSRKLSICWPSRKSRGVSKILGQCFHFAANCGGMLYLFRVIDASTPKSLPVDKWIQKFLAHLAVDRGASVYTQRNYKQALTEFTRWYHGEHASAFADKSASARQAVA